jgi:hypothetical protein
MRTEAALTIKILPNDKGNSHGQLADAELMFCSGLCDGLRRIRFAVWERRGGGANVTFSARQYSVNGERRSFALVRTVPDTIGPDTV